MKSSYEDIGFKTINIEDTIYTCTDDGINIKKAPKFAHIKSEFSKDTENIVNHYIFNKVLFVNAELEYIAGDVDTPYIFILTGGQVILDKSDLNIIIDHVRLEGGHLLYKGDKFVISHKKTTIKNIVDCLTNGDKK